jgi:hypothetical protein
MYEMLKIVFKNLWQKLFSAAILPSVKILKEFQKVKKKSAADDTKKVE